MTGTIDTPSIGIWASPFTWLGASIPAASSSVGKMSVTWWKLLRSAPASLMRRGHCTAIALRVPPKCEAICFIHWNGESSAQAHARL